MCIYICTRDRSVTAFLGSMRKWDLNVIKRRGIENKREKERKVSFSLVLDLFRAQCIFLVRVATASLKRSRRVDPVRETTLTFVCRLRLKAANRLRIVHVYPRVLVGMSRS